MQINITNMEDSTRGNIFVIINMQMLIPLFGDYLYE